MAYRMQTKKRDWTKLIRDARVCAACNAGYHFDPIYKDNVVCPCPCHGRAKAEDKDKENMPPPPFFS